MVGTRAVNPLPVRQGATSVPIQDYRDNPPRRQPIAHQGGGFMRQILFVLTGVSLIMKYGNRTGERGKVASRPRMVNVRNWYPVIHQLAYGFNLAVFAQTTNRLSRGDTVESP